MEVSTDNADYSENNQKENEEPFVVYEMLCNNSAYICCKNKNVSMNFILRFFKNSKKKTTTKSNDVVRYHCRQNQTLL